MERVLHVSENFADAENWDIQQNGEMSAEARLEAVEFLREQCWIAEGLAKQPRIQKIGRIIVPEDDV